MADPRRLSDAELEAALRNLAPSYPYPPTPNLAATVRVRIAAAPIVPLRRRVIWRDPLRLALAAALLLLVLGAAALVNPATRDAIAHFFHVQGVVVNRVSSPLPSLSPGPLHLGQPTTLEAAQSAVSFEIAVPPELGPPDAVYLQSGMPGGEVALVYNPRPGIPMVRETGVGVLVTEFRGDLIPGFLSKEVGPGTTATETRVNGDPGWWIAGQPHTIVYHDSAGNGNVETVRLAANTLVWDHGGVTYRIESNLTKADAMRIAAGLP